MGLCAFVVPRAMEHLASAASHQRATGNSGDSTPWVFMPPWKDEEKRHALVFLLVCNPLRSPWVWHPSGICKTCGDSCAGELNILLHPWH